MLISKILQSMGAGLKRAFFNLRTSAAVRGGLVGLADAIAPTRSTESTNRFPRVVRELSEDGYSVLDLSEIFSSEEVSSILHCCEGKISKLKSFHFSQGFSKTEQKSFLVRYSHYASVADMSDPMVYSCVGGVIRDIAEDYLGSLPKITNLDYWINLPVEEGVPERSSQKWHRDYEDVRVLKCFLYLNDVNDQNGPFYYASGSQKGGKYANLFHVTPPLGVIVEDSELEQVVPDYRLLKFTPNAGTLLFVDTAGLHKGGYCTVGSRHVFTSSFTTFGGISKPNFAEVVGDKSSVSSRSRVALDLSVKTFPSLS